MSIDCQRCVPGHDVLFGPTIQTIVSHRFTVDDCPVMLAGCAFPDGVEARIVRVEDVCGESFVCETGITISADNPEGCVIMPGNYHAQLYAEPPAVLPDPEDILLVQRKMACDSVVVQKPAAGGAGTGAADGVVTSVTDPDAAGIVTITTSAGGSFTFDISTYVAGQIPTHTPSSISAPDANGCVTHNDGAGNTTKLFQSYPTLSGNLGGTPPTAPDPFIWIDDSVSPACVMVWDCNANGGAGAFVPAGGAGDTDTDTYLGNPTVTNPNPSDGMVTVTFQVFDVDGNVTGTRSFDVPDSTELPDAETTYTLAFDSNGDLVLTGTDEAGATTIQTIAVPSDPEVLTDNEDGTATWTNDDGSTFTFITDPCLCPEIPVDFELDGDVLETACAIAQNPTALAKVGDALQAAGYF